MKRVLISLAAVVASTAAYAADLPTKKMAPAPAKPNCFATFWTWLDSTPTDCPLSYWGITFYGQVDVGAGYETNHAKLNNAYPNGVQELISKQSHGAAFQFVPNGLSQSNVGIKWKEQIAPNWFFIGDVNAGFDPYSLQFANGPRSLVENNTTLQFNQTSNGDSSRAYGLINTRAYAGFQNPTFGTLTYGRQYAFSNDIANSLYDPFGGAYAFSLIGNSSTLGGGLGDTEVARYTNSIKYLYSDHNIRVGGMSQVGGWGAGNNAKFAYELTAGFDLYGFSFDGVFEQAKDAVALGIFGAPVGSTGNFYSASLLKATIENETSVQLAGKYKWDRFTGYAGYEYERLSNPSDLPAGPTVGRFNDGVYALYGASGANTQGNNAFPVPKVTQVIWAGGKFAALPNVDLIGAFYHVWQNNFLGSTQTATGSNSCAPATSLAAGTPANAGYTPQGTANSKCSGTEDAVSGVVDWRPFKRLDVYAGAMYSKVNAGLANGYIANNNLAATGGVRLSF